MFASISGNRAQYCPTSSTFSNYRNSLLISAEFQDVVLDPLHCSSNIVETSIYINVFLSVGQPPKST